ncbi:MAG: cytochrome ubiquinol oxidase subunit I [Peptococcus niger]|nr:cytochrome ubiquinol oxidase subunit I [Clostridiales bacterium]MDU2293506.1 cytochrome ubiquinol oxidase subunit I [Peptococcus niger]
MFEQLLLARWQFAVTTVYHFLFVPLTMGLPIMIALMQTKYVRTGDPKYKTMTKFWGKLFIINFVLGVATGLVQEFQFGMNWSGYARFMGDIFGAPLAIEALAAFFIESTFIGIWVFGWDRLPKKIHCLCIWLVAFASNLSAVWILIANSFMQNPVGYQIVTQDNGMERAEMSSFSEVITNPYVLHQFPHVFTAGLCTAAFFVLGISAYHLAKGQYKPVFQSSFKLAAVVAIIASLAVAGVGHVQTQYLGQEKPMKLAAMEALWENTEGAPLALFAGIDQENGMNTTEVGIPKMLSFMANNDFNSEVQGINNLQEQYVAQYGDGNYIPDVFSMFWSFRIMVGAGSVMVLLALLALLVAWRKKYHAGGAVNVLYKILLPAMALPYLANTFGWLIAEMGRQPWIVYGLQKTEDAVSTAMPDAYVLITLVGFTLLYLVLAIIDVKLIVKYAKKIDDEAKEPMAKEEGSLWI